MPATPRWTDHIISGVAAEIPIAGTDELTAFRLTMDTVFHF